MKTEERIDVSVAFAIGLLACISTLIKSIETVLQASSPDVVYSYSIGMCFDAAELTCGFLTITVPSLPQAISSIKISKPTSMVNFGCIRKRTKAASRAGRYHKMENIENGAARVD
ncbi:uncharacterized protein PG986_008571 [Apiospora aurea]|uniref:Uncharacterized protein n=1 Tax=Apiospora aurea TaxID=335848 RepID=A0ABR1QFT1_9PEZI